jgi:hypothetical protein
MSRADIEAKVKVYVQNPSFKEEGNRGPDEWRRCRWLWGI